MPKQGVGSDFITHKTLIGLCKVGNLKETVKLFKQMKDSGNVPDVITYAILMDKLARKAHRKMPIDYCMRF